MTDQYTSAELIENSLKFANVYTLRGSVAQATISYALNGQIDKVEGDLQHIGNEVNEFLNDLRMAFAEDTTFIEGMEDKLAEALDHLNDEINRKLWG